MSYPYVGKSAIGRGSDVGENATPPPLGVFDLQAFPPPAGTRIVIRFKAPFAADYTLSDLAARRVAILGGTSTYSVYIGNLVKAGAQVGAALTAQNDQKWVTDGGVHVIGALPLGALINFTVDADAENDHDATEISWTLTAK